MAIISKTFDNRKVVNTRLKSHYLTYFHCNILTLSRKTIQMLCLMVYIILIIIISGWELLLAVFIVCFHA